MTHRVADLLVDMRPSEPLNRLPDPRLALWCRRLRHDYLGPAMRLYGGPSQRDLPYVTDTARRDFDQVDLPTLVSYPDGDARVERWSDQGAGLRHLARGVGSGPSVLSGGGPERVEGLQVVRFSSSDRLFRDDALGLAADPALTIAWQLRSDQDLHGDAVPRAILSLGTQSAPELTLQYRRDAGVPTIALTGMGGSLGAAWAAPELIFGELHACVLTKPAATGYDATSWHLRLGGIDLGAAVGTAGPMTLGNEPTSLGASSALAGLTCGLAGVLVWNQQLDQQQIWYLERFLSVLPADNV